MVVKLKLGRSYNIPNFTKNLEKPAILTVFRLSLSGFQTIASKEMPGNKKSEHLDIPK